MNKKSNLVIGIACGAIASLALIVACSDDSPGNADAAVCDCPAAEPPLAGRITSVTSSNPIQAGVDDAASALCPPGATVLGGACDVMTDDPEIQVAETGFVRGAQQGYRCQWSALGATVANTGTVEATCLVPAQ